MNDRDNSAAIVVALIVIGIPMLLLWKFSQTIGAEFWTTGGAVGKSIAILAVAGVLSYLARPPFLLTISGISALIWPCWWRVLDSIAAGGVNPDNSTFSFLHDDRFVPWYATDLFKYGVEAALVGALVWFLYKASNRY